MAVFSGFDETPFVVTAGEVFWVPPKLYATKDPRTKRPIVVVRVDEQADGDIHFVARTKDVGAAGVPHPRDRALGLDLDGVWEPAPLSMLRRRLTEPGVERCGMLAEPYWSAVLAMWRGKL